jgi:hypothetical protein
MILQWHHLCNFHGMKKKIPNTEKRGDLPDNPRDQEELKPEETTINLPDVEDIPGQENVRPPKLREFVDTTISSDDEEGKGIFEDELADEDTDVTPEEQELLERTEYSMSGEEDLSWENSKLDNTDTDGEQLNEKAEFTGRDLDVPGAEADDDIEDIGEEDEENNSYSLGQDRNDQ